MGVLGADDAAPTSDAVRCVAAGSVTAGVADSPSAVEAGTEMTTASPVTVGAPMEVAARRAPRLFAAGRSEVGASVARLLAAAPEGAAGSPEVEDCVMSSVCAARSERR